MSAEVVSVGLEVDYTALDRAEGKIARTSESAARVTTQVEVMEHKSKVSFQRVLGWIHQGYSMVTRFMGMVGFTLDATSQAMISSALSMATSLYAMATAAASNPWTIATAAFTFLSASMAMGQAMWQQMESNKTKAELDRASRRLMVGAIML